MFEKMKIGMPITLISTLFLFLSPARAQTKFSIVELNTWGVPVVVGHTWRYAEAMKAIEKISPDFVFLEEVFSHKGDFKFRSHQYSKLVNGPGPNPIAGKLFGSGLRLLSKYPVVRSARIAYSKCHGDDCLSRKGALLAVVALPDGSKLNLVGTHLNARGDDEVRIDQLNQLKKFIEDNAEPHAPVLLAGDFNFGPSSLSYADWLKQSLSVNENTPWQDGWIESHSASEPGLTYDPSINQWAHQYCIETKFPLTPDRIDLLFTQNLRTLSSKMIFSEPPHVSDHFGLYAEFEIPHNQSN